MIIYQPEIGYCYNSDSVFLYDFISHFKPRGDLLDVGAGCGIVGLLVARDFPKVSLEGVEKQDHFISYAQHNAKINNIKYALHHCDFLELENSIKYDFIISNPPFYPHGLTKSDNEMLSIARYNDSLPMKDFFKKVSIILKPHSHFVFCYDASQFGDICHELAAVKLRVVDAQFVHSKLDRPASIVMIHARNGSKSRMKVWPPFISNEIDDYSQMAKDVYAKASTQSIKCQM